MFEIVAFGSKAEKEGGWRSALKRDLKKIRKLMQIDRSFEIDFRRSN